MSYMKLWLGLFVVVFLSFIVLGFYGFEIYNAAPPIPQKVVDPAGTVIFTADDINNGKEVWQSIGGQEFGTIWGHGAYVAPDWSADWLHREAGYILDNWSVSAYGRNYLQFDDLEHQAQLQARLRTLMRANTYDPATGVLTISPVRAQAVALVHPLPCWLWGRALARSKLSP